MIDTGNAATHAEAVRDGDHVGEPSHDQLTAGVRAVRFDAICPRVWPKKRKRELACVTQGSL